MSKIFRGRTPGPPATREGREGEGGKGRGKERQGKGKGGEREGRGSSPQI